MPGREVLETALQATPPPRPIPNLGYACLNMDLREQKPPIFTNRSATTPHPLTPLFTLAATSLSGTSTSFLGPIENVVTLVVLLLVLVCMGRDGTSSLCCLKAAAVSCVRAQLSTPVLLLKLTGICAQGLAVSHAGTWCKRPSSRKVCHM